MRTAQNRRNFKRAQRVIPGGVNSPVRAFNAVNSPPIFIERAKNQYLYDTDGNRYLDYCMSWGPLILGHADTDIIREVKKAVSKGTSFGISTPPEIQLAKMITSSVRSIEKVRLVNSGTEAVMTAVRLARGFTGRDKIIKFTGSYHGHADHMLAEAGSGAMTLSVPNSPGVPKDFTKHTLTAPYNNLETVEKIFSSRADRIAAVIAEPVSGNMGVVTPKPGFLEGLRALCDRYGALLIFDEVITGYRLRYGCIQDKYRVPADLTCLGKIIGGGFPLAACGGRAEIMDHLSPDGEVYQAGTLSGNPVCAAAGIAALRKLKEERPYRDLAKKTRMLCEGISGRLARKGVPHTINRTGSMFTVFFGPETVFDYDSAARSDTAEYAEYFRRMLKNGIYLPPSQFETCFLSVRHTGRDIERTVRAV